MQLFRAEVLEKPEPRKKLFIYSYAVMAERVEDVEQVLRDEGRVGRHEGDTLVHVEPVQGASVSCGLTTRGRGEHKDLQAMRRKHKHGVVYDG